MFQIDNATAAGTKPASTPPGVAGYFSDGNPATNQPATIVPAEWLNSIMMELLNVLQAAGVTPDKAQFNQLAGAIGTTVQASSPVVGHVRNLSMNVVPASVSATAKADEIIVGSALGGRKYVLSNFNQTINLAIVGAGGMASGTATASGFIGIYAIYNPTSGASALLGVMEAAAPLPTICGVPMPSGYTASALLTVVPISATAGQFAGAIVTDRKVAIPTANAVSSTATFPTTTTYATVAPPGLAKSARRISGVIYTGPTGTAANIHAGLAAYNVGAMGIGVSESSTTAGGSSTYQVAIATPGSVIYFTSAAAGGSTITLLITITAWEI